MEIIFIYMETIKKKVSKLGLSCLLKLKFAWLSQINNFISCFQTPIKVADRLNQLKKEESHIAEKDIERER